MRSYVLGPANTYSPDGAGMGYMDNQQMAHMRGPGMYYHQWSTQQKSDDQTNKITKNTQTNPLQYTRNSLIL